MKSEPRDQINTIIREVVLVLDRICVYYCSSCKGLGHAQGRTYMYSLIAWSHFLLLYIELDFWSLSFLVSSSQVQGPACRMIYDMQIRQSVTRHHTRDTDVEVVLPIWGVTELLIWRLQSHGIYSSNNRRHEAAHDVLGIVTATQYGSRRAHMYGL